MACSARKDVFDAYSTHGSEAFDRTCIPVRLALYEGATLVSRSQARRLMARAETSKLVDLDFQGVLGESPHHRHSP